MGKGEASAKSQDETGNKVTVGSDANNDIVISGALVHPYHAAFTFLADGCLVHDLAAEVVGSCQVFLAHSEKPNEKISVTEPCRVSYADTVYLGNIMFPLKQLLDHMEKPDSDELPDQGIKVGTADACRIKLTAVTVSPVHAEFIPKEDGCLVRDCGSQTGTDLIIMDADSSKRRIQVTNSYQEASYNDSVMLGNYPFPLSRLREIKDIYFVSGRPVYTIGRADENDRVLDDIRVSNHHARFIKRKKHVFIEDLGSANGTFLNGYGLPARTPRVLEAKDIIGIGPYQLLMEPEWGVRVDYVGDIKLEAQDIRCSIQINGKAAFDQVSLSLHPGELLGIMGPSGHGKSLLLESMGAYIRLASGEILVNDQSLHESFEQLQSSIGYVPQTDILYPQLTVRDALIYAAKLWLPYDISDEEIKPKVNRILDELKIREDVRERRIGIISGGERKRVSIAHELIREPNLLFIDEPTTGLSVSDARTVMEFLRNYADAGRTVAVVIHQPGLEVYNMLDLVAIFFYGRIIYYGHRQYCIDYFCSEEEHSDESKGKHPDDIFDTLSTLEKEIESDAGCLEELLKDWQQRFLNSRECKLARERAEI